MNYKDKKKQLESIIERRLLPLIDNDYVLYGLPYYSNIGDTLIWDGERELLKKSRYKCVGVCGWSDYPHAKLSEDVVILITGGGYFGDVWRGAWENVLKGIEPNKSNNIIILPNSIFYNDKEVMRSDSDYLSKFPNLKICARDQISYEYAQKYFKNEAILMPDMAFCMNDKLITKWANHKASKEALYFRRCDKELSCELNLYDDSVEVHDWFAMEHEQEVEANFKKWLYRGLHYLSNTPEIAKKYKDWLYYIKYRPVMKKIGLTQLSAYRRIYTTRLHGMILGTMLGREIYMIDNSYGKLSSFYRTWLEDCDNVHYYNEKNY